jgi:uncharacterized iron-regulated protein
MKIHTAVFFFAAAGAAALPRCAAATDNAGAPRAAMPRFCILGGRSGEPLGGMAPFKTVVRKSDVLYAGGNDAQPADQEARLETLKALSRARGSKIAVGFETLGMENQPALDEYAAGALSEAEFLNRTGWLARSAADFSLYRPIFDFIIGHRLRALALGVPGEVIFKVERKGLAALDEEDKRFLPPKVTVSSDAKYLDFLRASHALLAASGAPLTWENYAAAAAARDEGAGSRVAGFASANPGWAVLVLAGNDRLLHNAAIPASVKRRAPRLRQASFYVLGAAECPAKLPAADKELADYVWYLDHAAAGDAGKKAADAGSGP